MSALNRVSDLIEIILSTVAQEAGVTQDQLSVEVVSVVTRGVLEAYKRGDEYAHDRPTEPPVPRNPTPRPMPSPVRHHTPPMPFQPPRRPASEPTVPVRPRIPTPHRRKRDQRED